MCLCESTSLKRMGFLERAKFLFAVRYKGYCPSCGKVLRTFSPCRYLICSRCRSLLRCENGLLRFLGNAEWPEK